MSAGLGLAVLSHVDTASLITEALWLGELLALSRTCHTLYMALMLTLAGWKLKWANLSRRSVGLMRAAAIDGHLKLVQLGWAQRPRTPPGAYETRMIHEAAEHGRLEVLKWMRSRAFPWDEWAPAMAAQRGHLEVLQYLHANGCPWDFKAPLAAVNLGQLAALKYLHAHGCPPFRDARRLAADLGHVDVLEWLRANPSW